MVDLACEGGGSEPRAAAEIDGALEEGRFADRLPGRQHGLEQQRGAAIAEVVDQRLFEFGRVLIKQCTHIGFRHRRQFFGPEQHEVQTGAMPVLGIRDQRFPERRDRRIAFTQPFANFA